jgi:hypothetical protein
MSWNTDTYPAQYYGYYTPGKACKLAMDKHWVDAQAIPDTTGQLIFFKQTLRRILGTDSSVPTTIAGKNIDAIVAEATKRNILSYSVASHKKLVDETNEKTEATYADAKAYREVKADLSATKDMLAKLGF